MAEIRQLGNILKTGKRENPNQGRVYDTDGIAPTITTMKGGNLQPFIIEDFYPGRPPRIYKYYSSTLRSERTGLKVFFNENQQEEFIVNCGDELHVRENTKQGYAVAVEGDSIDIERTGSRNRRGRVGKQISQTLMASPNMATVEENLRVRKLTPRECWRLMDCTDEDFDKAASVISNSRLYACAGNAIIVNVLVAIMGQLFEGKEEVYRERG